MMKIIFVVSSPNSITEEYKSIWQKCLQNGNRKEIVDDNNNSKNIEMQINSDIILYVFDGVYYYDRGDFVETLANEIEEYISKFSKDDLLLFILFHGDLSTLQKKLNTKYPHIIYKEYHKNTSFYTEYICLFGICDKNVNKLVKNLLNEVEGKNRIAEAYSLFLPLDIDMQALEILAKKKENGVRVKVPKEYLEEMYADNIDYVQKLKELQAKVNTIGEIENINKERLKKLAGISNEKIDQFFEKLGGKKNDPDDFLDHSWGIDGVNSFHDWYCALTLCLGGAEGCEGK